jgi:fatty-acyl-CoA synthase
MRTVVQVLRDNVVHTSHAVTFVRTSGEQRVVSYPDLDRLTQARARWLYEAGLAKGDRVALVLPETDDFVLTFLGCLQGGLVPVPMYPPQTLAKLEAYGDTVRHVLARSGAKVLLTSEALAPMLREHVVGNANVRLVTEREVATDPADPSLPLSPVSLDDLAFLQFTSGSTSAPKGVMVTYGNLAANAQAIMFDGLQSTPADKGLSWLPLFHDMGLIGFVIAPLYALVQVMFLPTMAFIRRPSLWLDSIHRYRATITFAPNFAFALATRAITQSQASNWDLSCMRALGCGAEPIQADVLRAFLHRFGQQGLRPESILPSYGMAEATLAISFTGLADTLHTDQVDAEAMRQGRAEAGGEPSTGNGMELVCCGRAFPGHELRVVGPSGDTLGHRRVGEIWVRGPSVAKGYFGDAAATEEAFGGGWLRTGDLGYTTVDGLYICGRAKDLIILNGKNHYPQDIEAVVSRVDGVRDGQCVAFSRLDASGGEHAVVVAEARRHSGDLIDAIRSAVRSDTGIVLGEVHLIKRGTLPKTSSGKVKRREAKRRLDEGELSLLEAGAIDADGPASGTSETSAAL